MCEKTELEAKRAEAEQKGQRTEIQLVGGQKVECQASVGLRECEVQRVRGQESASPNSGMPKTGNQYLEAQRVEG